MTVASLRLARTRQGMSRAAVTGARTLNRADSERGRPVPFGDDGSRSGGAGRLVSPRLRRFDSCGPLSGQVMVQAAHAEPADSRPNASNVALHGRACTGVRPHVDRRKVGRVPTLPHHLQQGGLERPQRRPHKPVEACSTHAPASVLGIPRGWRPRGSASHTAATSPRRHPRVAIRRRPTWTAERSARENVNARSFLRQVRGLPGTETRTA